MTQIVLFLIFLVFPIFSFAQEKAISTTKPIILDALDLRDIDINDALKLIANKSGLNIIAGRAVQGRVTIFLKDVEVHEALTIILKSNNLAYVEDHGVIQIMPESDYAQLYGIKFGRQTQNKIVTLKSIKAMDALALLMQMKTADGRIVSDDQSNTLMIEDVPEKVKFMINYLQTIDLPTQWQTFELKFVSVEGMASKITEQLTPRIGATKFDVASNKLFIKDTPDKLKDFQKLISQIDIPRQTKVFKINYAKADNILKAITPMLTKDIGAAQSDVRSNTLVVTVIAPKIEEMKTIVEALDKNEKEVLIEARIIQITLDDSYKMGVNWEAIVEKYHDLHFTNNFGLGSAVSPVSTASIGTLSKDSYNAVLNMIATMGKTKVLSNPRIAVINNEEARILIGTTKPYVTTSSTTTATGPVTTAQTVNFIDVGVKLHVTPTIHDDGYITMKIKPEVSSAATSLTTSDNNQIPIVDTSEVETVIRVKDDVTIIIGGLIKDEVQNSKDKIPVLGDIPLLGKAFRRENRSINKTETIIFLTPHIISGDVHVDPEKYPLADIKEGETYYSPVHESKP